MRISDWSSDVCSSDLLAGHRDRDLANSPDRNEDLGSEHALAGFLAQGPAEVSEGRAGGGNRREFREYDGAFAVHLDGDALADAAAHVHDELVADAQDIAVLDRAHFAEGGARLPSEDAVADVSTPEKRGVGKEG